MQSSPKEHLQVIAAVIRLDDRYLVCRRPSDKQFGGLWEFPGGKLEPGETLVEAAARELSEELDLDVTHVGDIEFSTVDETSSMIIHFTPVVATGIPKALEHTDLSWLTVQELLLMSLAPSDFQFVRHLVAEKVSSD